MYHADARRFFTCSMTRVLSLLTPPSPRYIRVINFIIFYHHPIGTNKHVPDRWEARGRPHPNAIWSRGKRLVWHATCVNTLCESYAPATAKNR
jgi:hypothetical protein